MAAGEKELLIGAEVPRGHRDSHAATLSPLQERRVIRAFFTRVILFCAPVLIAVGIIEALLWHAGETWTLERVIRFQEKHPQSFFYRKVIDQGTFRYKYLEILRRRPQILVLGSSRTMQFRAEMFGRQAPTFYNAGGVIHSVEDLLNFLERLPAEATPKVVILGIDFWWLNPNQKRQANDSFLAGIGEDGACTWQGHANVISGYLRHPNSFRDLLACNFEKKRNHDAIGVAALLDEEGFRLDGSMKFDLTKSRIAEISNRRSKPEAVRKKIFGGLYPFAFTDQISAPLEEQLRTALSKFKERGVLVIGFTPPVIDEWARVASIAPRQRNFWKQFQQDVPALFQSLDFPFWDTTTPAQIGLDDRYMRNPYHPHETFDLKLLQLFCDDPRVRAALPDVPAVAKEALRSPRTTPLSPDLSAPIANGEN